MGLGYHVSEENFTSPASAETSAGASSGVVSPLAGKRVVIVEDEAITQMLLQRRLTLAGLKVVGYNLNGEQGVETVLRERPDLVLMDITMPGAINGIEALRQIQAEFPTCVVMLTAYDEYRDDAEAEGASGYLLKPLDGSQLVAQLAQAYQHWLSR